MVNRRDWIRQISLFTGGVGLSQFDFNHNELITESLKEEEVTRLLFNENPYGPAKSVLKRIDQVKGRSHRYATFFEYDFLKLKNLVAKQEGLQPTNVALSHGSIQALIWLAVLYGGQGKEFVAPDPAFDVISSFGKTLGTNIKKILVTKDLKLDLKAMEAAVTNNTSMVVLINPNNPTSTTVDPNELKGFCSRVSQKCPICIDEAYIHYLGDGWRNRSMASMIKDNPNIMVTRTFSKIYGMAGLRMGLLLASEELVSRIESEFMLGFPGNSPSILGGAAAMAALEDDKFIKDSVRKNNEMKSYVYDQLDGMGREYVKSDANFFYFKTDSFSKFKQKMNDRKILVAGGWPAKKEWGRVTFGNERDMQFFFKVLKS